ncbi:hypothetical protein [Rahnella variigena]|uniref:hypothetical protein n=1 Tax=Rahnella variigena TaxID=574964 RepID=UPI0013307407|nr:hypothetical protein [Rahnella variigena]
MRFSFFKTRSGSQPDSLLKKVSLYVILAGLLVLVAVGMSFGLWGVLHKPLPLGFFVTGVMITAAGCAGLMLDDAMRVITCQWRKYNARKGGTR